MVRWRCGPRVNGLRRADRTPCRKVVTDGKRTRYPAQHISYADKEGIPYSGIPIWVAPRIRLNSSRNKVSLCSGLFV